MTLTDEIEIFDDKIKANQANYDLDREAAKMFALSSRELDKYKYLTGKDLGYKPGVFERVKFDYSSSGEALNKGLKKDDKVNKVVKYENDLTNNSVHNFSKYSVSNFNKIPSIESKFDALGNFYKDFKKLGDKSPAEEWKQKKKTLLKNASMLYDELISIYKKEYNQAFKSKGKDWRQTYDFKNLKDLDYELDQLQPDKSILPKWVKWQKIYLMRYRVWSMKLKRIN